MELEVFKINKITKKDKVLFVWRNDLIGDYIVSRSFLQLIKNTEKFKNYKVVLLVNIALKDLVLEFDSKYVDEIIFCKNNKISKPLYRLFLWRAINKYKYEYALNYMSIRNSNSEKIGKIVKAKHKCAIDGPHINLTEEQQNKANKYYTEIYKCQNCDYSYGPYEFLKQITGEEFENKSCAFELDVEKSQKYNFKTPYMIMFPSASYAAKRLDFSKFLLAAKYYASASMGGGVKYT